MAFQDLHESVLNEFAEAQFLALNPLGEVEGLHGFQILERSGRATPTPSTPERRAYSTAWGRVQRAKDIAERLLAGERPAGRAARSATRRVAAELGITLAPVMTRAERGRAQYRRQIRQRLLAGDRPKHTRSPLWDEVAKELGLA